ncbi:PepSY domain-containing protein [Streptomyces sp. NPDC001985]|uniref:PepSY domain-containing protein n=1 Tax=Streptomyces sp. NPDC001985 TaxID=3154406 RepID=UPI003327F540
MPLQQSGIPSAPAPQGSGAPQPPGSLRPAAPARPGRARAAALFCALAVSVPLVAGCGGTGDDSVVSAAEDSPSAGATPSAVASLSRERTQRRALVESTRVGWEKAASTATGEVPQSELVELDLGRVHHGSSPSPQASPPPGTPRWTATVALKDGTAHVVDIDAVSGKVLRSGAERDQDADDKRELAGLLAQATRTPQQAVDAATRKHPGTVTGLQLGDSDESGDNVVVWETEVADTGDWTEADVEIDAASGKVLRERIDQD